MRILICGDRNWLSQATVNIVMDGYLDTAQKNGESVVVIEGEARGADTMGRIWGEARKLEVLRFPAEWNKYGRSAGPIRNQQMLSEGKPTHVVAFHLDLDHSKGTKDMVNRARRANLIVNVISKVVDGSIH